MSENLRVSQSTLKEERYSELFPQIQAIVADEPDKIANMANVAAMLWETFHWWWIGFYRVVGDELVLGPFQGPMACTRIRRGRGVCGTCWQKGTYQVVPDVTLFPGHIACSSKSRSEIVVPLYNKVGEISGVLDIDSERLSEFDATDRLWLERIAKLL